MAGLCLAIDGASPFASAALAAPGILVAEASGPARGGRSLLELVDDCFRDARREPAELDSVIAVCGPGSFTGVRVTLATAMGLVPHPSPLALRGISSLAALALQAPAGAVEIVALVDALQGEWFHQRFARRGDELLALDSPSRSAAAALELEGAHLVYFADGPQAAGEGATRTSAQPLSASIALAVAAGGATALLEESLRPIYLRAPAVTPPRAMVR